VCPAISGERTEVFSADYPDDRWAEYPPGRWAAYPDARWAWPIASFQEKHHGQGSATQQSRTKETEAAEEGCRCAVGVYRYAVPSARLEEEVSASDSQVKTRLNLTVSNKP